MIPSLGDRDDGSLCDGKQDEWNEEIMVMEKSPRKGSAREYGKLLLFRAHSCFVITRAHFP